LVGIYPWLFAASRVLHRFLLARHPPLALRSLGFFFYEDARARYEVLKGRMGPSATNTPELHRNGGTWGRARLEPGKGTTAARRRRLHSLTTEERNTPVVECRGFHHGLRGARAGRLERRPTSASTGILVTFVTSLLRKEVIQPHLPVRLPCYDFTPIAHPTFGSSLPEGLGH
jgi:hypothetical protein